MHSLDDDIEVDPLSSIEVEQWNPPAPTKEAINKYLRRVVNKPDRVKLMEKFPIPSAIAAQTPVIDQPILHLMAQRKLNVKQIPGALAMEAIQSRLLDSTAPLAALHAAAINAQAKDELMQPKAVLEAVNHTLLLIGNTNSQITYQRQRAILSKLSPHALSFLPREPVLADDKELFGQTIRKSIKEAAEVKKDLGMGNDTNRPVSYAQRSFRRPVPYNREYRRGNNRFQDFRGKRNQGRPNQGFSQANIKGEQTKANLPIGGRISNFYGYWKKVTDDQWVLK